VGFVDESAAVEFGQLSYQRSRQTKKWKVQPFVDEELMELQKERTRLKMVKPMLDIAKLKREANL
jgi:hypothetical protein